MVDGDGCIVRAFLGGGNGVRFGEDVRGGHLDAHWFYRCDGFIGLSRRDKPYGFTSLLEDRQHLLL